MVECAFLYKPFGCSRTYAVCAILSELHVFVAGMIVTVWIRMDHQQGGKS
jgi:hypothetical protein